MAESEEELKSLLMIVKEESEKVGLKLNIQVDGGSGWGTHVHPQLIHINVLQKPLWYCKEISLQLK